MVVYCSILQGYVVYANPANACDPLEPPPQSTPDAAMNFILVASRLDCNLREKMLNAKNAGYTGIIIHNVGSNETDRLTYVGALGKQKKLDFASFIGEYDGQLFRDKFNYTSG